MKKPEKFMETVKSLKEGAMLSHPLIKRHVDYALATGDSSPLFNVLKDFPNFKAYAQRNTEQAEFNKLVNPFSYPEPYNHCGQSRTGPEYGRCVTMWSINASIGTPPYN